MLHLQQMAEEPKALAGPCPGHQRGWRHGAGKPEGRRGGQRVAWLGCISALPLSLPAPAMGERPSHPSYTGGLAVGGKQRDSRGQRRMGGMRTATSSCREAWESALFPTDMEPPGENEDGCSVRLRQGKVSLAEAHNPGDGVRGQARQGVCAEGQAGGGRDRAGRRISQR